MTAAPLMVLPTCLAEPPLTAHPVPQAVLHAPFAAVEPRSRRVYLSRRTDGATNRWLCVGSWEMFAELGVPVTRRLFKEYDLGAFLAMWLPQATAKQVAVAATELPADLFLSISDELAALHAFNADYYRVARVVGGQFTWVILPPPAVADDPLSAPTGITSEQLEQFLVSGWVVGPDRNDHRVARLLNRPDLPGITTDLTNKNAFWRLLRQAIDSQSWQYVQRVPGCHIDAMDFFTHEPLHLPEAVLIDTLPLPVLEEILASPADQLAAALGDAITTGRLPATGTMRPGVEYFVKAVGGASGNAVEPSIARLVVGSDDGDQLRAVLGTVRRQIKNHAPIQGLQLLAPIASREANRGNPCDLAAYFSPCLIWRTTSTGEWLVAQAADQVLKAGTDYCGASFWSGKLQQSFLAQLGPLAVQTLIRAVANSGYVGYFGTDFIQDRAGRYVLVADGNARMNGNDVSYAVRNALEIAGQTIDSACQCPIPLGEVSLADLPDRLTELLGAYRFDPATGAGVVLSPSLNPAAVTGGSGAHQRKVMVVYCNPTADRERFDRFWSECFGG